MEVRSCAARRNSLDWGRRKIGEPHGDRYDVNVVTTRSESLERFAMQLLSVVGEIVVQLRAPVAGAG